MITFYLMSCVALMMGVKLKWTTSFLPFSSFPSFSFFPSMQSSLMLSQEISVDPEDEFDLQKRMMISAPAENAVMFQSVPNIPPSPAFPLRCPR